MHWLFCQLVSFAAKRSKLWSLLRLRPNLLHFCSAAWYSLPGAIGSLGGSRAVVPDFFLHWLVVWHLFTVAKSSCKGWTELFPAATCVGPGMKHQTYLHIKSFEHHCACTWQPSNSKSLFKFEVNKLINSMMTWIRHQSTINPININQL